MVVDAPVQGGVGFDPPQEEVQIELSGIWKQEKKADALANVQAF